MDARILQPRVKSQTKQSSPLSTGRPSRADLAAAWIRDYRTPPPKGISTRLLALAAIYNEQARRSGGLKPGTLRSLQAFALGSGPQKAPRSPATKDKVAPGTRLVREWRGEAHVVDIHKGSITYRGKAYRSLSHVARAITGARWSGPRFFGV